MLAVKPDALRLMENTKKHPHNIFLGNTMSRQVKNLIEQFLPDPDGN